MYLPNPSTRGKVRHKLNFNGVRRFFTQGLFGLVGRVFASGPGTGVQSQVGSYQRLKNGTWYLFT